MVKNKKIFLFIFILVSVVSSLVSADFEIEASVDATKIGIDDVLIYTVRIKGNNNPKVPDISQGKDFNIVQTQRGSEFSIINGASSYYTNFTFYLSPKRTGKLIIPKVVYVNNGKTYKTRAFEIEVVKGKIKNLNGNRRMGNRGLRSFFDDSFDDFFDTPFRRRQPQKRDIDVFLKTDVSKTDVVVGEQVLYTIYLYSRNRVTNISLISDQSFPGFFQEWKPLNDRINAETKEYNGKVYQVYEIRKVALFPTKSGKLEIPPLKFAVNIYFADPFSFSNTKKVFLTTEKTQINAKKIGNDLNLPVGNYKMRLEVLKSEIDINDILTAKLIISGKGNIKTIEIPKFKTNPYFKIFEPVTKRKTMFTEDGITGVITSEINISFKKNGLISLPSLSLKVFNPTRGAVEILKTKPVQIRITGKKDENITKVFTQRKLSKTAEDITYIKEGKIRGKSMRYYENNLFLFIILISFLLNFLYFLKVFVFERFIKNNETINRKRFFSKIKSSLLNVKEYGEIHSIIEEYFKIRIGVGFSELTNELIESFLTDFKISKAEIDYVLEIKTNSESAKFSPIKLGGEKIKTDISGLLKILKKIENRV